MELFHIEVISGVLKDNDVLLAVMTLSASVLDRVYHTWEI